MKLFAQIKKVDEAKRLVFGRAAEEAVDKSDEIMDYASSKPHFQKWSEDIAKDTDGKNLGNVRAMHGKVAAGGLTAIDFNDTEKAVDVCAKITDDQEWRKVLAGTYTGFSIGGAYVGDKRVEKVDGKDVKRYTAKPSEISLVDRPCMQGAKFFEVQKADGAVVKVDFIEPEPETAATVKGTAEEVEQLGKLMNDADLAVGDLIKAFPAFLKDKKKKGADAAGDDKAGKDDAAEEAGESDAEKAKEAEKVAKAADAAMTGALEKLETALSDALLAKAGARNSKTDADRIAKIHAMTVELGHDCAGAMKQEQGGGLAKVEAIDTGALQKVISEALAPMQKLLEEQRDKITKLEAQPMQARIKLRAVAKSEDGGYSDEPTELERAVAKAAPIVDDHGDKHEAAGLIKLIHSMGGTPLSMPLANIRK